MPDVVQTNRLGVIDQGAENTAAFWQMPDALAGVVIDPFIDERCQVGSAPPHAERAIAGLDQIDGRTHDRAQCGVQIEIRCDH